MADQVVSFALETIGKLLVEEGRFLAGVEDQVKLLEGELKLMQANLRVAEEKNIENQVVQEWISDAKNIAYDVEDLVEKYAFRFGSSTGVFHNTCAPLLRSGCYDRHNTGMEIQPLSTRISNLKKNFLDYGIQGKIEKEGSSPVRQHLRRTYSFADEKDFVGLHNDVDMLVKHLVAQDYRVVSITGMGGLGKTTIANKVYNHPATKRHFDGLAWICVSQPWQRNDILQRILIKLLPEKEKKIKTRWSEDELLRNLLRVQQEKSCLIVLDDVWTTNVWDCIKVAFPTGNSASKIMVTTRIKDVALCFGPDGFHHEPRLLDNEECWELLRRKSRPERHQEGSHYMKEFETLGKEMVKKCGGLPLAVIVLGGILLTKTTPIEWEMWKGNSLQNGEVKRILELSYYELPYRLKSCFLYLGCFPEDTDIDANTIYQLWMAEGMVSNDGSENESMMELAEQYLAELGQRSMVQLKMLEYPGMRRRFKSCRLHDLMRELCLQEVKRERFLTYVEQEKGADPFKTLSASKHRRLVINLAEEDDLSRYISSKREITKNLRMFQFQVTTPMMILSIASELNNFEMLRVLRIEGCMGKEKGKLPKAIGKLIHLRYLSLRDCYFYKLPSSLGNLKYLQTLDLKVSYRYYILHGKVPILPDILLKMEGLICLYLFYPAKSDHKIRLCGLNRLEILEGFDDQVCETEDLLKLHNLRVLEGRFSDFENVEKLAVLLGNPRLEHASITTMCDFSIRKEKGQEVLRHLLSGRSIHTWNNNRKMWKFPEYESGIAYGLVDLFIDGGGLDIDEMCRELQQFPNLAQLSISFSEGKEMCFSATGFPKLEQLTLAYVAELENWVVEEGAMPNLRQLWIYGCTSLKGLPDGFCSLKNLEHLYFHSMGEEFKEKMRKPDGEDFHKISHVPFVEFIR